MTDDLDIQIGHAIRARRRDLEVPASILAQAIGISHQQLTKYERGLNRVAAATLVRIAFALDCPPETLLPKAEAADA